MHVNWPAYLSNNSPSSGRRNTKPYKINASHMCRTQDTSVHNTGNCSFWIECFGTRCFYVYNRIQDKQWYINCIECQHHVKSIHFFIFLTVTIYFWYFICNTVYVNWMYWFCMPLCLPENGDLLLEHVGGLKCMDDVWFFILYKLCASVGVYGWL